MTLAVPLRVRGIDLDDDATLGAIAEFFCDVEWSVVDGVTIATVFIGDDAADPVCNVVQVARLMTHKLPGAQVPFVHQELVSIPDIAHRVGVSRETVRTWVEKIRGVEDFPEPLDSVGGGARGATRVWAWTDVADWLQSSRQLVVDDFGRLTPSQVADLNASLARVQQPVDVAWTSVSSVVGPADLEKTTRAVTPSSAQRAANATVFAAR